MRYFLISFLIIVGSSTLWGQGRDLKKAQQLFKEDKYAQAIPYYQKVLTTKKNLSIKSKLAFCYKITNQIPAALELYEDIVRSDRAKTQSYYYYAETLMSSGRYDEAKRWFKKYAAIETEDESIDTKLAACDFAKTVQPYFETVQIERFPQNSEEDDNAPVFWSNGIVFTSDRKGKLKFLDTKSGATDRSYLRLYYSEQQADGQYSPPKEYISKINDARKNTGMATFQPNGQSMFFTRNGHELNRQNAYCLQLFEAKSDDGKQWSKATLVPFCRKAFNYMHPSVSADGKLLFFVSDKSGGLGGTDIYVSKKQKNRWSKPENLGNIINTAGHEGFPFMHPNGQLFFCSKGHLGLGGFDIFVTELDKNGEWKTPTNLGAPINSPADDISIFIDETESRGLFTSSREGGDDDIFLVDFTGTMTVTDSLNVSPLAESIMVSTSPVEAALAVKESGEQLEKNEKIEIPEGQPIEEMTLASSVKTVEAPIEKLDFLSLEAKTTTLNSLQKDYILPTIQFASGEYFVTFDIAKELDKVATILREQPNLRIEIAAHTANLGQYDEKMALTQNRADAIIDYLQVKGVDKERLVGKGYGGQQPLNKCFIEVDCSVEEHAINDRVEVTILKE
ncbi:MAG: OmpA family protein [Bacteroidota bacterium]